MSAHPRGRSSPALLARGSTLPQLSTGGIHRGDLPLQPTHEQPGGGRHVGAGQQLGAGATSGCWTTSAIYTDLGSWVHFHEGAVLNLVMGAPGHAPQELSWVIAPTRLTVTLEPIPPAVDFERLGIDPEAVLERPLEDGDLERMAVEAADLLSKEDYAGAVAQAERTLAASPEGEAHVVALAARAHALTALWRLASEARAEDPSEETIMVAHDASVRVVAASRAWLAALGPLEAVAPRELCVAATLDRGEFEPWEQELWPEPARADPAD